MKVIICGAGQVGWQIARHLASEKNDVTVVDNNPDLVARATETLDVQGVTGFASYPDILARAGARDADMLVAATHSDEVNMVTCQVAHSIFAVPRKIARLRAQSYLDAIYSDLYRQEHLPIDVVISPEREVADAALRRLTAPSAFDVETFFEGRATLLGLQIEDDCPVVNTPLRQLTDLFSTLKALVVGVRRDGTLFVPEASDQLFPGDQVYVCSETDDVNRTLEIFGKEIKRQDRVVIIGGGNVGLAVAEALEARRTGTRAKVIELDRGVAERAADALERTVVLHGNGMDIELLKEAGITRADAVLAVTDDDKVNMLAAVRAKAAGCPMAICLINDTSLIPLMEPLQIDAHINPRATTVSSILRHIRHGRVRNVYSVGDAEAEVIEAQVLSTSPISGHEIRDIEFPEGVLVGAVLKKDKVVRPTGGTRIEEGDVVVIFAMAADVPEVERLLQVSIDFF
ncbi:Trk system potassium transporter TrkA [Maritimibacter sp. HL-12]|uniref:Trk system potassium transporter TrkA n=1 Tax=Maritimibacter sp. HL-12 TaxID=1162418 RepID=UPI000A0F2696|nr:Trk system potassium transporter TrkA [Maritimibacter sp. HL-12]SMH55242.1 trk system potassium uptake protein TrkA [Maritimibacter sp. HL-12]